MKFHISIDLPSVADADLETKLHDTASTVVIALRGILKEYKALCTGLKIPTISIKTSNGKAASSSTQTEKKQFIETLLKIHMDRCPTAVPSGQRKALSALYEAGFTDIAALKDAYEKSVQRYSLTSWFTVRGVLARQAHEPNSGEAKSDDMAFERKVISAEELSAIAARVKNYK